MYNEKKITLSKPKLLIGIPLSSTLTPFLLALYLVKKTNIKYIMAFLNLFFIGLILLFFYLGHKK
jgi:hypothetical protein